MPHIAAETAGTFVTSVERFQHKVERRRGRRRLPASRHGIFLQRNKCRKEQLRKPGHIGEEKAERGAVQASELTGGAG